MPAMTSVRNDGLTGLVLPGGGARGAYQAGVLLAIAQFTRGQPNPFPVITGASVGAINAASIASNASDFAQAAENLCALWSELHADNVYRTDLRAIGATATRWLASFAFGGLGKKNPPSLLDNAPLKKQLQRTIDLNGIDKALRGGALRAVGITASSYGRGRAVTFFQGERDVKEWQRARREGVRERLTIDHLMASSSLPFLFPARRIGREYFGDGSLRSTSPLSPAIHLGADRLLVIGARDARPDRLGETPESTRYPSLGELGGYMLDLLFLDNLQADTERLSRINRTLSLLSPQKRKKTSLRPIQILTIEPSQDLRRIAGKHADAIPRSIRMLLRGVGAWDSGWRLASYLLFEPPFIQELIALGQSDAIARRREIETLLGLKRAHGKPRKKPSR
ncbi:MAG: patatin-like phospholipase family protein [Pseudomonadota bacterium]|nr:patatin-like phospholipase family protein [Pseudomonadota bacterium]